jgi:PII-like signaling protein
VVEIVDSRDKLERFLQSVEGAISEGLATLERLEVCFYRSGTATPSPTPG